MNQRNGNVLRFEPFEYHHRIFSTQKAVLSLAKEGTRAG